VHGTPIYAALKGAHPNATIIVATRSLGYAVLQHDPHIDHLLDTPDPGDTLLALYKNAQYLRNEVRKRNLHPTLILQDASNRRGTLALFAALLRLAPTTGFADIPQLYDTPLAYDPTRSLIDNNLRLVPNAPHIEPAVYFTEDDLATARTLLQHASPNHDPITAFVLQGSGAQPNSWHDDRFATVIAHAESLGHRTIFLGTDAEAATIDRIRALANSSGTSLAGRTTIPELAALLCLCDALITVDTGSMHVARAVAIPMIVLGPSWQPPVEWLPLTVPNAIVLRGEDIPTIPAAYRLDEVTTTVVVAAYTQLIRNFPPSSAAREQRIARLLTTTRALTNRQLIQPSEELGK
jgi:ADP-heptose:LPS heptosyltransferase